MHQKAEMANNSTRGLRFALKRVNQNKVSMDKARSDLAKG